jgi:predicted nucleic acid-binding protein
VILVDANLLTYAHVAGMASHARARAWLEAELTDRRVGMPWPSLLVLLRIVTNPRVFERPELLDRSWKQVKEWLALDSVADGDFARFPGLRWENPLPMARPDRLAEAAILVWTRGPVVTAAGRSRYPAVPPRLLPTRRRNYP